MTIRPKTERRILILLGIILFLAAAIVSLWIVRSRQLSARLEESRQTGMAAFDRGDYQAALDPLRLYIEHIPAKQLDAQALFAFAITRSKVPMKDEADAIQISVAQLRRYCELVPSDGKAQEALLEMEMPFNAYAPDALGRAGDILRISPDNLVALKTIAQIDTRYRKFPEAFDAADKYVRLNPTDLELQRLCYQLMQALGRPGQEMHQRAAALLAKYPNDPRFLIVKAMAYQYGLNDAQTLQQRQQDLDVYSTCLLQAAALDPPNVQFVRIASGMLDGMLRFDLSLDLLTRAAAKFHDPQLTDALAVRYWENHQFDKAVALLKNLNAADPNADTQLIAYKALCLYELNQRADADALVAQLARRGTDDHSARAWAIALQTYYAATRPQEDFKPRLAALQAAAAADSRNGYVAYILGQTYAQMGETDLALQAWRRACALMPSWSEPHARLTMLLVSQGNGATLEAQHNAEIARLASTVGNKGMDLSAVIASIQVSYARLPSDNNPTYVKPLLDQIEQVQQQFPNEPQSLAIDVALLARIGQRDKAIDAIQAAEKNPGEGGQDLLFSLVGVSRTSKLGMEPLLYQTIEKKYGMTPRLAYMQASQMLDEGDAQGGLKFLQACQVKAQPKTRAETLPWDRILCQYRQTIHDPTVAQAWQKLGETYPDDISVQSTILAFGESVWADHALRPFLDRTIDRLKKLTGEQADPWKIFRARWLLSGDDPRRDAPAAIALLNDLLATSPEEYYAHVLLAMAYEKLQNGANALDEWRKAAGLAPDLPNAQLDYLKALHDAGKTSDTSLVFNHLAALHNLPPDMALAAATIMASENKLKPAEDLLMAYPHTTNQVLHDATLAKVYRLENQPLDAKAVYLNLDGQKTLDVNTIREAADFFGARGDMTEAHKFLDRLDSLALPPGQKQLLQAEFNENHGSLDNAGKLYTDAANAADDDPVETVRLIGFLIRQRQWTAASSATKTALNHWPDNPSLTALGNAEAVFGDLAETGEYRSLIEAVAANPQSDAANQTIAVIATEKPATFAAALVKLQALLEKYPNFEPLYELVGRRLSAAGQYGQAAALAAKAMGQFPQSIDAARATAEASAAAGRWVQAIIAGEEWRRRAVEQPRPADLFLAAADLFADRPSDCLGHLAPYIPQAKANPDANRDILVPYVQALIRVGNSTDAAAFLRPLAEKSPAWRADWLGVAVAFPDGPSATAWIEQIHPLLDPHSLQEQYELAQAYCDVASQRNYPRGFAVARDTLRPFVGAAAINAQQLLTFAIAASGANDSASAERAYREMLKLDPANAIAQNNLADLLCGKGDAASLKEAEALARQVVAARSSGPDASSFCDTLARILVKESRPDDAIAIFKQGYAANPTDLNILIGLAWTCGKTNKIDQASGYLTQIDAIVTPNVQLSVELRSELQAARDAVAGVSATRTGAVPSH